MLSSIINKNKISRGENMMYTKMEKIGDIFKLLSCGNPKRITFDLSEDGTFYNAKIYIDIVDKSKDEEYEGYIECKSRA